MVIIYNVLVTLDANASTISLVLRLLPFFYMRRSLGTKLGTITM